MYTDFSNDLNLNFGRKWLPTYTELSLYAEFVYDRLVVSQNDTYIRMSTMKPKLFGIQI